MWGWDYSAALERFQRSLGRQAAGQLNQATVAILGLNPTTMMVFRLEPNNPPPPHRPRPADTTCGRYGGWKYVPYGPRGPGRLLHAAHCLPIRRLRPSRFRPRRPAVTTRPSAIPPHQIPHRGRVPFATSRRSHPARAQRHSNSPVPLHAAGLDLPDDRPQVGCEGVHTPVPPPCHRHANASRMGSRPRSAPQRTALVQFNSSPRTRSRRRQSTV
jgi:hypothetical protein